MGATNPSSLINRREKGIRKNGIGQLFVDGGPTGFHSSLVRVKEETTNVMEVLEDGMVGLMKPPSPQPTRPPPGCNLSCKEVVLPLLMWENREVDMQSMSRAEKTSQEDTINCQPPCPKMVKDQKNIIE